MGFNKKYLLPLKELKKELEKYPEKLISYIKADVLIGSPESIEYLDKLLKNAKDNKNR